MNKQVSDIIMIVAKCYGISPDRIRGKERTRAVTHPRRVAFWLCSTLCGLKQDELGLEFDGRSPCSVSQAVVALMIDRREDAELDQNCSDLLNAIRERKRVYPRFEPWSPAKRKDDTTRPKPNLDVKPRKCLMCHNEFMSSHIGERVCKGCKETRVWRSGGIVA